MDPGVFAPPRATVADASEAASPRRRPALVWVIVVSRGASLIVRLVAAQLAAVGAFDLHPALANRFAADGGFHLTIFVTSAIVGAVSTVQLFRMRKSAPFLMSATFAVGIYSTVSAMQGHPYQIADLVAIMTGLAIGLASLGYEWSLYVSGRLQKG